MALGFGWILMKYKDELTKAMNLLAKDKRVLLVGQTVKYGGTSMFHTLKDFPEHRTIELPLAEEMQMGQSLGLALEGFVPLSVYPRFDFLILALNQLVNHIDKCEEMSDGQFTPKVIIRVGVGSVEPLMPGPQHIQDYTNELTSMCSHIDVVKLTRAEQIVPAYEAALKSDRSTILVEIPDLYNDDLEKELKEGRLKNGD